MELVLVRHGVRQRSGDGGTLSERGKHQVKTLAQALRLRGTVPDLVLSSGSDHARETAQLLSMILEVKGQPIALDSLTPRSGPGGLDAVLRQANAKGVDFQKFACVVVVGHEGRLSDLFTELTGTRSRPVPHGGAVSVCAAGMQEFACGRGKVKHRYPTTDHQEEPLRAKINSKMTVSTFLAGFVFTALSAVLVLDRTEWPWHRVIAATTLTASLALFIAAVYIFDQLGTPSGFWTDADRPKAMWRRLYEWQLARMENQWTVTWHAADGDEEEKGQEADDDPRFYRLRQDGPAYWLMVRTSKRVFTPAVVLALAGFIALLIGTGDARIWAGGIAGLALAGGYAAMHRPDLGAD